MADFFLADERAVRFRRETDYFNQIRYEVAIFMLEFWDLFIANFFSPLFFFFAVF